MTVVVLNTDEKSVVIAADTLWVDDNSIATYATKLTPIMRGTKRIGMLSSAGDARLGIKFEQTIVNEFKKRPANSVINSLEFLRYIVDDVWTKKKCPPTIVVIRGSGYVIDEDGLVTQQHRFSIGSGADIALGAMWGRKGTAARLAKVGCQAACDLTVSCGGDIEVCEFPKQPP